MIVTKFSNEGKNSKLGGVMASFCKSWRNIRSLSAYTLASTILTTADARRTSVSSWTEAREPPRPSTGSSKCESSSPSPERCSSSYYWLPPYRRPSFILALEIERMSFFIPRILGSSEFLAYVLGALGASFLGLDLARDLNWTVALRASGIGILAFTHASIMSFSSYSVLLFKI